MLLEVPLRDVHPVGQEIPHHVPKLQIGQWADIACPRLKAGVILVIKPAIKGLRCLGIEAHLKVRSGQRRWSVDRSALGVTWSQKCTEVTEGEPAKGHAVHELLLAPVAAALSCRHCASCLVNAGPITTPEQQNAVQLELASRVSAVQAVVDGGESSVVPPQ